MDVSLRQSSMKIATSRDRFGQRLRDKTFPDFSKAPITRRTATILVTATTSIVIRVQVCQSWLNFGNCEMEKRSGNRGIQNFSKRSLSCTLRNPLRISSRSSSLKKFYEILNYCERGIAIIQLAYWKFREDACFLFTKPFCGYSMVAVRLVVLRSDSMWVSSIVEW